LAAFFYGYQLTQIPGGWLAQRLGGKWVFGVGIVVTSILTIFTPLAADTSVWLLVALRVLEGLFEVSSVVLFPQPSVVTGYEAWEYDVGYQEFSGSPLIQTPLCHKKCILNSKVSFIFLGRIFMNFYEVVIWSKKVILDSIVKYIMTVKEKGEISPAGSQIVA